MISNRNYWSIYNSSITAKPHSSDWDCKYAKKLIFPSSELHWVIRKKHSYRTSRSKNTEQTNSLYRIPLWLVLIRRFALSAALVTNKSWQLRVQAYNRSANQMRTWGCDFKFHSVFFTKLRWFKQLLNCDYSSLYTQTRLLHSLFCVNIDYGKSGRKSLETQLNCVVSKANDCTPHAHITGVGVVAHNNLHLMGFCTPASSNIRWQPRQNDYKPIALF